MNKIFFARIIYDIIVLISLLSINWWCTLFLCFFGVILFQHYYECLFAGILLDVLYGMPRDYLMNTSLIFTAITSILIIGSSRLKIYVRYG